MAASPSQQLYNSSTLSTDMIDAAFQHIGGLSTSGIAPREWEEHCQYYPLPINITQEDATPCSLHEKAAILTASAVRFHHGEELIKNHISTEKERKVRVVLKRKKQEKCLGVPIEKRDDEEEPFGHIHVRARRGQATDSHSLAERVRRERINERMKKLQGLVPGCDKVSRRALLLDEIINYVQSLQNQVENHIFHDQVE